MCRAFHIEAFAFGAFEHCGAFPIFIMASIDDAGKQFSSRSAKVKFLAAQNQQQQQKQQKQQEENREEEKKYLN